MYNNVLSLKYKAMKTIKLLVISFFFCNILNAQIIGITVNPPKAGFGLFSQFQLSEKSMLYFDCDYGKYKALDVSIFKPGIGYSHAINQRSYLTGAISYNFINKDIDIYKFSPQLGGIIKDENLSFMVMVDFLNWEAKIGIGINF